MNLFTLQVEVAVAEYSSEKKVKNILYIICIAKKITGELTIKSCQQCLCVLWKEKIGMHDKKKWVKMNGRSTEEVAWGDNLISKLTQEGRNQQKKSEKEKRKQLANKHTQASRQKLKSAYMQENGKKQNGSGSRQIVQTYSCFFLPWTFLFL